MTSTPTSLAFEDKYIPQHDEAELERLQGFYKSQGLGQVLTEDDELRDVLIDFGMVEKE